MILIDLQKAFDTNDHDILLEKMPCLEFSDSIISWFRSNLTNRYFSVSVGKELSTPGKLIVVFSKAQSLALLFLLYVNDMAMAVNCELLLYVDDTCLLFMGKDTKEIEDKLNRDFSYLCEWFEGNTLKLQLHDAIHRLRFYSNSLTHILSLSISHNDVASIQKNRGNKSHRVTVALPYMSSERKN